MKKKSDQSKNFLCISFPFPKKGIRQRMGGFVGQFGQESKIFHLLIFKKCINNLFKVGLGKNKALMFHMVSASHLHL